MNISILGCGWLGLPLAKDLKSKGHIVKGSTTSHDKMPDLTADGIIPYQIKLFEEGIQGDIDSFLNDAEILIIDIPPGLRKNPNENFIAKLGRLKDHFKQSPLKHLIFVSSTAVFEDRKEMPVYTEDDVPTGIQVNSEQLKGAEKLLKSDDFKTSIIRFGGLYGPGRNPVNYLSGRKNNKDPGAPVNLIHLDDCIGIINAVIISGSAGVIHGVNPDHPTKEEYYTSVAGEKNLPEPQFDHSAPSKGKFINSVRVEKELDYVFGRSLMD